MHGKTLFVHDLEVTIVRPEGLRAGFNASRAGSASGLHQAGEQWASPRFMIQRHTHPVWELYLQVHGLSRWVADGERYTLAPGHLLAVGPGVVHHLAEQPAGNHHFSFAAVDVDVVLARHPALGPTWRAAPRVACRPDGQSLMEPFAQLVGELTVTRPHAEEGLCLAVDRLVVEATRIFSAQAPTHELAVHPAVHLVRDLLDRDCARHWTLAELAERARLAPTYLAALFARQVGMPPLRYLNERRIDRARQLLRTSDLPVTAISIELGFGSPQHFARVFRRATGCTPREYRNARSDGPALEG